MFSKKCTIGFRNLIRKEEYNKKNQKSPNLNKLKNQPFTTNDFKPKKLVHKTISIIKD